MIVPIKTSRRDPMRLPPIKPSWYSFFLPSANNSRKPSQSPSTIPTVLKSLNPSGKSSNLPNQQPSGVTNSPMLQFQARNLIMFLVVAQVISLVEVYQLLRVYTPVICQVLNQTHCLHIFEVRKTVTSQSLIHYRLQLVGQIWFHLFNLVN